MNDNSNALSEKICSIVIKSLISVLITWFIRKKSGLSFSEYLTEYILMFVVIYGICTLLAIIYKTAGNLVGAIVFTIITVCFLGFVTSKIAHYLVPKFPGLRNNVVENWAIVIILMFPLFLDVINIIRFAICTKSNSYLLNEDTKISSTDVSDINTNTEPTKDELLRKIYANLEELKELDRHH